MPRCSEGCFNERCVAGTPAATTGDAPSELTLARSGNVIELLEALLDRAKKGEIVSVAVAWEWMCKGGGFRCAHGVGSNAAMLSGFLGAAQTAIAVRHLIPREDG